jgi:hypothetical protein
MGCVVCDQRSRAEKAEAERDELKQDVLAHRTNADAWKRSCKEAEAERDRLREALEIILTADPSFSVTTAQILQWWINVCEVARAALAPSATGGSDE